jgi:hypothetical protein
MLRRARVPSPGKAAGSSRALERGKTMKTLVITDQRGEIGGLVRCEEEKVEGGPEIRLEPLEVRKYMRSSCPGSSRGSIPFSIYTRPSSGSTRSTQVGKADAEGGSFGLTRQVAFDLKAKRFLVS